MNARVFAAGEGTGALPGSLYVLLVCAADFVLFAALGHGLTTPVLRYVSMGHWPFLAILAAAACGVALSLLGVSTPVLSCGVMAGLLIGGILAAWKAPNDVAVSLNGAFASHLESFWREILILTAIATLAAFYFDSFRKGRVNVRLGQPYTRWCCIYYDPLFRYCVPVQTVDATPSNALIREWFPDRTHLCGRTRTKT